MPHFLDYSGEGIVLRPSVFHRLMDWCAKYDVEPEKIVYFSQNLENPRHFDEWRKTSMVNAKMRFGFAHMFLDRTLEAAEKISSEDFKDCVKVKQKPYRFLSLNNAPRFHRALLLAQLQKVAPLGSMMSLSLSKYSQLNRYNATVITLAKGYEKSIDALQREKSFLDNHSNLIENFDIERIAKSCNLEPIENPSPFKFDEDLYKQTMVSVVGESEISSGAVSRFTEKSIKPALFGHPFIIAGNPGVLDLLRRFGLQTFPELFDEEYDDVLDWRVRIEKVLDSISRVSKISDSEFYGIMEDIQDKILFNSNYLRYELRPKYLSWLIDHISDVLEGGEGLRNVNDIGPF